MEYTEGPHEGDVLCFEMVLDPLFNLVGCDINVNGVSCDSCEISIEPCGLQANEAEFMVADCRNVDEIGYEVNECTHTDYTGILSSFFTSYDHVGACVVDGSLSFGENSTEGGATGGQNRTEGEGVCYEEAFAQEDFWPEFERSCNCTGNEDGTTTLYCIDGCESCTFQADVTQPPLPETTSLWKLVRVVFPSTELIVSLASWRKRIHVDSVVITIT